MKLDNTSASIQVPLRRAAWAVACASALAACGSAPVTSYYTLTPPAPAAAVAVTPSPRLIEVLPVGVPEALDQPQIVIRKGDSGVAVLENERWAAPLSDEMRGALSAQLSRRLGTQDVAGLSVPIGQDVLRIKLQVRRFDAWPDDHVSIDADWSISQANDAKARLTCRTALTEPATGGYAGMVQAQQRALARLSQTLAAPLAAWPQGQCP